MLGSALLFLTAILLALTAGRAFWVSIAENPFNMPGSTYVEFFQQVDRRIAIPIALTGIGGTLLAGLAALMHRNHRRVLSLLVAACGFALIGSVVTATVNVPINQQLATWNPNALPPDYQDYLHQWWQWHQVRLVAMFTAMCLVFAAMIVRK